jgi:hypothetical protein
MSTEVWATYSVEDHLDRRALAADIMLFDRLVFPVPQSPISFRCPGQPSLRGGTEVVKVGAGISEISDSAY